MLLTTIRKTCMVVLPISLAIAAILHLYLVPSYWHNFVYTILLTANIGYFTNYVAIQMLFKPHYKTVFGRQGLIPKNQNKLADNLSDTLANNFLSKQQWHEYLVNSNLINNVVIKVRRTTKIWVKQPDNIHIIVQLLLNYLKKNESVVDNIVYRIQQQLASDLSSQLNIEDLMSKGFGCLSEQFDKNPEKMQILIEPIIKTLAENIPEIAESLVKTLDHHIEEQETFKRGIAKIARWSADISTDDIKHYLFRMVASFEFRETLFNGLKALAKDYQHIPLHLPQENQLNKTENVEEFSLSMIISKALETHLTSINWVKLIEQELSKSKNQLNSEVILNVQNILLSLHSNIFVKIEKEIVNKKTHDLINTKLSSMIDKLNLRELVKNKAVEFSPNKIEMLFKNMISEPLIFIELLGAILGALSGLALIDLKLFVFFSTLLLSYYLIDSFLTWKRSV